MPVLKARIGGAWVDVGGGADEVFIGPSDPIATAPATELWYDTDEPAVMTDDLRWNTAWGQIAFSSLNATQTLTTIVDLTGLVVTVTPPAGRRLKVTLSFRAACNTVGNRIDGLITDGSNTQLQLRSAAWGSATSDGGVLTELITTSTGSAMTFKGRCQNGSAANTITVFGAPASLAYIMVEDIGPVAGAVPALPPLGGCRVRRVATQLLATGGSSQDFIFDTEDADTHGYFAPSSTTVTIPAGMGGLYLIGGEIGAAANTGTTCYTDLKINNVVLQRLPAVANASPPFPSFLYNLAAGDTIKIAALHTAGVSVNFAAKLNVARIGVL